MTRHPLHSPVPHPAPLACPKCGSAKLLPLLYGPQPPKFKKMLREGTALYGGCIFDPDLEVPDWRCTDCGASFME